MIAAVLVLPSSSGIPRSRSRSLAASAAAFSFSSCFSSSSVLYREFGSSWRTLIYSFLANSFNWAISAGSIWEICSSNSASDAPGAMSCLETPLSAASPSLISTFLFDPFLPYFLFKGFLLPPFVAIYFFPFLFVYFLDWARLYFDLEDITFLPSLPFLAVFGLVALVGFLFF